MVLPVCPVQAQSTLGFFGMTSENRKIGMTGLTSGQRSKDRSLWQLQHGEIAGEKKPAITGRFFIAAI